MLTIKEFILEQAVAFSMSKTWIANHVKHSSLAREIIENCIFELDLPFVDKQRAKSFMSKADYERIKAQAESECLDKFTYGNAVKEGAGLVYTVLKDCIVENTED